MQMKQPLKLLSLAALALSGLAVASATAQNNSFQNGDLILGFQSKGGTGSDQTVLINLGNTATVFRDATVTLDNITNINTILTTTFGAGWFDNTNLYFGAAGVWSNIAEGSLQNGDPEQTIYMSKARTAVGNEAIKNSTLVTPSASNQTAASNNIMALNGAFEIQPTAAQVTIPTANANTWEDFNAVSGSFVQATAFTAFTGGVQQRFGAGSFGTFSNGAVEGALDLYRGQGQNAVPGQSGEGGALRVPQFEGILTVDQAGNVDFLVVPEPSSAILLGVAVLGLAARRRRTVLA